MNSYKHIPIWENARRMRVLEDFRNNVISYFNNSSPLALGDGRSETPEAVKARQRINLGVNQAHLIIEAAGVTSIVQWSPPPLIGGDAQRINLIDNLFELDRYRISPNHAVGFIERAIGVYQFDRKAAFRRTVNPFWWLGQGLLWFVRVPFVFLSAVGFDADRAEGSFLGKTIKAMFALVTMAAALLTILNLLGWLPGVKAMMGVE